MGLQRIPFNDFSGGINASLSPYDLDRNEAIDALNCRIIKGNALQKRGRMDFFSNMSEVGVVGKPVTNLKPWARGANNQLYASIHGEIWAISTAGNFTSKFTGTAGKTWCFQPGQDNTQADHLWCMNGTDSPKKISDAGAVSNWGGSPPNGTMCIMWKNRMIVSGVAATPQRILWSDIGDPESPSSGYGNNWLDVKTTDDDIDPITGLAVVRDNLVVFKANSTWVVSDDISFANSRIAKVGCVNHYASVELEERLYFFAKNGLYSTSGYGDVRFEGANIEPWILDNLNYEALGTVRTGLTTDRTVLVAVPTNHNYSEVLWEYYPMFRNTRSDDRTVSPWMKHLHRLNDTDYYGLYSLAVWRIGSEAKILTGVGYGVRELFSDVTGGSEDGPTESWWESSWISFIAQEPKERIRRLNVELSGSVFAYLRTDFNTDINKWSGLFESQVSPPVDPLWDGGVWDGGVWDEKVEQLANFDRARPESRGRYHSIKLENSSEGSFTIYSLEFVIRGGKEH